MRSCAAGLPLQDTSSIFETPLHSNCFCEFEEPVYRKLDFVIRWMNCHSLSILTKGVVIRAQVSVEQRRVDADLTWFCP